MSPFSSTPRSWIEVDHTALRQNLAAIRKAIGPSPGILAVVKANAYGHGDVEVARTLAHDVEVFGVANLAEARALRSAATDREIMLMSACLPEERREAVEEGFIVTVSSAAEAMEFAACGRAKVNFKVDTGMGRLGVAAESAAGDLAVCARHVCVHSISTHLPSADEDQEFTQRQLEDFQRLLPALRSLAPAAKVHVLNSAGALGFPDHAGDLVRAGLALYGWSPVPELQDQFTQALTWKTRITHLKTLPAGSSVSYGRTFTTSEPTRVAALAVGYADGYPRQVSGRGAIVLIRGTPCAVLGRVTMDQILVAAPPEAAVGDEAILTGRQGDHTIPAGQLADLAGTIVWDIFTGISHRVQRVHLHA